MMLEKPDFQCRSMESPHGEGNKQEKTSVLENSSSSSSSSSSSEDLFQLDPSELGKPAPAVDNITQSPLEPNDVAGVTQSPPNQVMGKSDEQGQYRIPAYVFTRTKSTTPMEWSVASNESLFSIHVGNTSFSRDHGVLLDRSGDLSNLPSPTEAFSNSQTVDNSSKKDLEFGEGLEHSTLTEAANAETMKEIMRATVDERNKTESLANMGNHHSLCNFHHSDGSSSSNRSFAFPILTDGKNRSVKVNSEQVLHQPQPQQEDPQVFKETPKSAATRWFPCFTCCPFCT